MHFWNQRFVYHIIILLLAATATLLLILPDYSTQTFGTLDGDNAPYLYMIDAIARTIGHTRQLFVDPQMNFPNPHGLPLALNDAPFPFIVLLTPLTWWRGPIVTYNTLMLLNTFLTGLCMYAWIYEATRSRAGALFAGLAFMLSPYREVHSVGHLNLSITVGLPLFFWMLERTTAAQALRSRHRSLLHLGTLAGATTLVGGSSQYYLVICGVCGAAYVLLRRGMDQRWLFRCGPLAAGAVIIGAISSALPYLTQVSSGHPFVAYTLEQTRLWSAEPLNFLLPSHFHLLWDALPNYPLSIASHAPMFIGEKTLYLGVVSLLLAALAVRWRRQLTTPINAWAGTALVAFVFALGTDLHWNNLPVAASNPIWLPAAWLSHLPFMDLMRVWSRFGVITILFVCALAGAGLALLLQRVPHHRQPALMAVTLLLLCMDVLPGWWRLPTAPMTPGSVATWLSHLPAGTVVAGYPISNPVNSRMLHGAVYHQARVPSFIHPMHKTEAFHQFTFLTGSFPAPQAVAQARALGIQYAVLWINYYDGIQAPAWAIIAPQLENTSHLHVVARWDEAVVVKLGPSDH